MLYLYFCLFLLLSLIQLFACLKGVRKLRMLSKVFLMPLLALCWYNISPSSSLLVFFGILLGGLGDIGLLWPMKGKSFFLGMAAFFAGHICYILYILQNYSISASLLWLLLIPLIYLSGSGFIYIKTRSSIPSSLRIPCFFYMLALSSLSALSLLVLISSPSLSAAISFAGASLFLISDAILSQALFIKKAEPPFINFLVMLTYISAQLLLVIGWAI